MPPRYEYYRRFLDGAKEAECFRLTEVAGVGVDCSASEPGMGGILAVEPSFFGF